MSKQKTLRLKRKNLNIDDQLANLDLEQLQNESINKLEDLEDGSTVYEIGKDQEEQVVDDKFDGNLALTMDEKTLDKLSNYIIECIDEDIKAREPWLDIHNDLKKYLGFEIEDKKIDTQACRLYDSTFSTALLRSTATICSELLKEGGCCGFKIFGQKDEELESVAKTRAEWLNYHLTVKDAAFYEDCHRAFFYTNFYGLIIKKVWYDDILKYPISRFILPENFIFNLDCTSVLESDRLTHILKLSTRDILINQKNKQYKKIELPYLKTDSVSDDGSIDAESAKDDLINVDDYSQRTLHDVYECHWYLNLDMYEPSNLDTEIKEVAKPYIVTIDRESKKIFRIQRNWKKEDTKYERRKFFVGYRYSTGFDVFGLGMARIAGSNAKIITNMLRQTYDAATYQNIPSGFIQKGATKQQMTDIVMTPGKWSILDCTGGNIRDMFAPLPANGPSQALMQMKQEQISQMQEQLSSAELGMMDSREDIPTGTAIAFLEENNKLQSWVLKSLHNSMSEELRLLDDIFKETIDREEFFINGENHIITKEHYIDSVQIVPVSDPSVNSTVQRIMRAEAVMQTAMQVPDKIDITQLIKLVFEAQGLSKDVIEGLIIKNEEEQPVEPADPITENMNMMQQKPVKAGLEQNHDAHIVVHSMLMDNELAKAHIQEHMALKFFMQMQMAMGIDLNQVDMNDPDVANEVALRAAQAVEELGLNTNTEEDNTLDPNALLAADIEQKKEANQIKKEISDKEIEAEIFKTQLHFEQAKMKMQMEKEKAEVELKVELEKLKKRYG